MKAVNTVQLIPCLLCCAVLTPTSMKQMECEELSAKVETLTSENMALRNEINLIAEESESLKKRNLKACF